MEEYEKVYLFILQRKMFKFNIWDTFNRSETLIKLPQLADYQMKKYSVVSE